jgi:catechol 2,3-dioxygenase-like lactoylglutathione lyase family enzyme
MSGPRLFSGTVCVPDMNAALALYRDVFAQTVLHDGVVSAAEAAAWQAPNVAGARSVVMQPPSGAPVYLRLIEQANPPGYKPGTHFGWAALELTVESADAMHMRLQEVGTPIIAAPKVLPFTDNLYPMQARGSGGEALYLNQVRGPLPSMDLPIANCWVDQLFIAVMGCRDMRRSLAFYNELLGTTTGGEWEMPYSVINISFGLPLTTTHKLATAADARTVLFEVDQYPDNATAQATPGGALAQGIAMIGVRVSAQPRTLPANANWLTPPAARPEAPYFGAMVGVVRGPDGELTELIW